MNLLKESKVYQKLHNELSGGVYEPHFYYLILWISLLLVLVPFLISYILERLFPSILRLPYYKAVRNGVSWFFTIVAVVIAFPIWIVLCVVIGLVRLVEGKGIK